VTFHAELDQDPARVFDAIEGAGAKAGMVVNPPTDVRRLAPWLDRCAMVLVMSVNPGFAGQGFLHDVLAKIPVLRGELGYEGDVEIDGGISPATAPLARKAGANVLVAGSAIFGQRDRAGVIRALREG
jgi:ribulose-phosphate 3-epimerase